ncbi:NAD-dependent epimerase/dehydratase family protein [Jannaschia sp. CCS1]|uniref:NAD-dependent epimerase/dehydratase family protein n=1 Tax=Jannaschia sp. (strain CCS1) TaxID=290400 RepID=UPI0000539FE7|nr:NAD(P)-dependent oxidoreductase [Jannaschia sp. CCS1]ABD57030.1 NAD-dependent epimerase/dehydratase [Jannaschia sp. CCS1]
MSDAGAILVTGAGGFVCSEVVLALHRRDVDVVAVDQTFDAETRRRLDGVRCIEGDLPRILSQGLGPVTSVIHGAAITASPEQLGLTRAEHIRRNMDLLTATLAFAQNAGATGFLFVSSMGVFEPDDTPDGDRFTEATPPTATCTYCAAKRAGELLTTSAAGPGFATASLRLGNIFGAHEAVRETRQHLCLAARMIAQARAEGVITVHTPDAVREWSWLPDLADGIAAFVSDLPTDGPQVLHAGTPPTLSDLDLARAIADRVPGTTIRLGAPPHAQIRPPMASRVPSVFDAVPWTNIPQALDQLIPEGVTP